MTKTLPHSIILYPFYIFIFCTRQCVVLWEMWGEGQWKGKHSVASKNYLELAISFSFLFFCSLKNCCTVVLVLMLHWLTEFYLGLMGQSHSYGYEWSFAKVNALELFRFWIFQRLEVIEKYFSVLSIKRKNKFQMP